MSVPDIGSALWRERIEASVALSRFRRRWSAERLEVYRRHLQSGIVHASPLVAEAGAVTGVDVVAQMWRLRPPHGWPDVRVSRSGLGGTDGWLDGAVSGRRTRLGSAGTTAVAHPVDPRLGPIVFRIGDRAVELSTTIGGVLVRTQQGFARIRLPFRLPDQVAGAAPGQAAGMLIGHHWFAGRDWPIHRVVDRGSVHEIVVATGLIGFEMPWRRAFGLSGGRGKSTGAAS